MRKGGTGRKLELIVHILHFGCSNPKAKFRCDPDLLDIISAMRAVLFAVSALEKAGRTIMNGMPYAIM